MRGQVQKKFPDKPTVCSRMLQQPAKYKKINNKHSDAGESPYGNHRHTPAEHEITGSNPTRRMDFCPRPPGLSTYLRYTYDAVCSSDCIVLNGRISEL
jgi:hypothetical protein